MSDSISSKFPRYEHFDPKIPVWCITPNEGRCTHRFFDNSPISPSGRFATAFRLPFEDRNNEPGDAGEVLLIDLTTAEERVVAKSYGWSPQLGANINWGADDNTLVFNDVDTKTWTPLLVKLNPHTGEREEIPGSVYHVSPDGRYAASASLDRMDRTQIGYGVTLPREHVPMNMGAPEDDGLWITDLNNGERKLLLSLAEATKVIPDLEGQPIEDWQVYGFHSKWSPTGEHLIYTVRRFRQDMPVHFNFMHEGPNPRINLAMDVLTLKTDGTEVCDAVPNSYWEAGGHHMNWCPDGKAMSMNLVLGDKGMLLVRVDLDGANLGPIVENVPGSGHPTVHPSGKILTDSYTQEKVAFGDGTVPLRWIDMKTGEEETLVRIGGQAIPGSPGTLRVDPHPAWHRDWRWVSFNGVRPGEQTRRLFVADFGELVS